MDCLAKWLRKKYQFLRYWSCGNKWCNSCEAAYNSTAEVLQLWDFWCVQMPTAGLSVITDAELCFLDGMKRTVKLQPRQDFSLRAASESDRCPRPLPRPPWVWGGSRCESTDHTAAAALPCVAELRCSWCGSRKPGLEFAFREADWRRGTGGVPAI